MSVLWQERIGPQVIKFERVSSDDHQMSVVGSRCLGLMYGGGGGTLPIP